MNAEYLPDGRCNYIQSQMDWSYHYALILNTSFANTINGPFILTLFRSEFACIVYENNSYISGFQVYFHDSCNELSKLSASSIGGNIRSNTSTHPSWKLKENMHIQNVWKKSRDTEGQLKNKGKWEGKGVLTISKCTPEKVREYYSCVWIQNTGDGGREDTQVGEKQVC